MARQNRIQVLRGTTTQLESFTPLVGELVFDTDLSKAFIGDGSTVGGLALGVWNNALDSGGPTGDIYYDDGNVHIGSNTAALEALQVTGNIRVDGQFYASQYTVVPDSTGTAADIDWDNSNSQVLDLDTATGDVTIDTITNGNAGGYYVLKILQGATPRDITWPGNVVWTDNEPTLSDTASGIDLLTFYYDGTNYISVGDIDVDGGTF